MANAEQANLDRAGLNELLQELGNVKTADYVREGDLGAALSFKEAIPHIEALLGLYSDLARFDLKIVPDAVIKNHRALAFEVKQLIDRMRQFTPAQANPKSDRDAVIERARAIYDGQWQKIAPTLAYCTSKGGNFDGLRKQVESAEVVFRKATEDAQASYKATDERAKQILRSMEEAAANVGVDNHAIQFNRQADEHKASAYFWMSSTIVLAAVGGYLLHFLFIGGGKPELLNAKDASTGLIVFEVVTRLMVFSFLSFGMYWSAKNYAAHRHNYVVNRHRQNALSTFKAFVAAAGVDQSTKNAVLLQASQAIYLPQTSGYTDPAGVAQQTTGIFEIIKSVTNKPD